MSLNTYMRSINKIDEISESDEHILADMIENGDDEERTFAIELLTTSNLKLVVKIAHDYRRDKTVEFEDIVSAGNTGLMKAAERFRNGHGAKFSTHASWWIKQAIRRYIDNKGLIRIPCAYSQKIKKLFSIKNDFENKNRREPTVEELSNLTGFSAQEVKNIMKRRYETTSLDMEIGDEGSLHDILAFNSDTYWTEEKENILSRIMEIVNSLPENEKYIIVKRFGLDGTEPQTLENISVHIGRTKERIRQIQNNSLKKIRKILDEEE